MFRSYLTVAIRNLMRQKVYSLINVVGLAVGLSSVILIGLFISYELSYDSYHADVERKYRVIREMRPPGKQPWADMKVTPGLAPVLKNEYPEVESSARVVLQNLWVKSGERVFEHTVCVADSTIFDILTIPLVNADWRVVLSGRNTIVMSESMAAKYFPDEDPIGQTLSLEDNMMGGLFTVSGVMKNLPMNSSFRFDLLTLSVPPRTALAQVWNVFQRAAEYRASQVLLKLRDGVDHRVMEARIQSIPDRHLDPDEAAITSYYLQPLKRVRLHTESDYGIQNRAEPQTTYGSIEQVNAYALVAAFLLVIACMNFVNLSTARAGRRAREVGIRKASGAVRMQLVRQFLSESTLLSLLSVVLAVGLSTLLISPFSLLVGIELSLDMLLDPSTLVSLTGVGIVVGLLAGSYPAFVLSRFPAADVLRGDRADRSGNARFRKAMVVLQFTLSIIFVIATLTVGDQLHFIRTKNLGFLRDGIVEVDIFFTSRKVTGMQSLTRQYRAVKEAFLRHPNIQEATSTRFPQGTYTAMASFAAEGVDGDFQLGVFDIDETYLDFYGVEIIEGRNFDYREFSSKDRSYRVVPGDVQDHPVAPQKMLNETAARMLGWTPQEALGKRLWGKLAERKGEVIAVVKDFHTRSLHREFEPVVFAIRPSLLKHLYLKLGSGDVDETIVFMKETWDHFLPVRPFSFRYMEDRLTYGTYANEIRTENVIRFFSVLAVLVACMRLLGLVSYMAEQRTKEIGVRRTLGAPVTGVMFLLTKDFLLPVLLANLVAWPIAYFAVEGWLQDFAFRVDVNILLFLAAGVGTLTVSISTVGYQAFKAANSDPVRALRTE